MDSTAAWAAVSFSYRNSTGPPSASATARRSACSGPAAGSQAMSGRTRRMAAAISSCISPGRRPRLSLSS